MPPAGAACGQLGVAFCVALAILDCLLSLAIGARELNLCRPQVRRVAGGPASDSYVACNTAAASLGLLQRTHWPVAFNVVSKTVADASAADALTEFRLYSCFPTQLTRANELRIVGGRHLLAEQVRRWVAEMCRLWASTGTTRYVWLLSCLVQSAVGHVHVA